jgi:soluble lytic murein transglycosylase-like protein
VQLGHAALPNSWETSGAVLFLTPRAWSRFLPKVRLRTKRQLRIAAVVAGIALLAPIVAINLSVAFFGSSVVFPLSPFFLGEKLSALGAYAVHRPLCLVTDHPDVQTLIARAEVRNKIPRGLLAAIIQVESSGRPHRISSAGAMGLGQLMPSTARRLGVTDPFDSDANIDGASRLMAENLARFRGNIAFAVAAYNAGAGAVNGRVPQNGQTPAYVARVLHAYGELKRARAATAMRP